MNTIDPSDLASMPKELAALSKKHSKSAQTPDKKLREASRRDMEEKAIKLGKSLTGEVHMILQDFIHIVTRDEGRKKEASKVKQTTRQSNTAHPHVQVHKHDTLYLRLQQLSCFLRCPD